MPRTRKISNLLEKKTTNRCQYEMTEMLELSDKDFKVAMITMLHQAIRNMLETSEKIGPHLRARKSQQKIVDIKMN